MVKAMPILNIIPTCRVVASIEMSMGQMVEDVERSVRGQKPVHWFGKCGGEVPTPEEVVEFIRDLVNEG